MKKDLGVKPAIFPMPVLLIATYNEDNTVNVMNAAWGMMLELDQVVLNLSENHKTVENILRNRAFTVALADKNHICEADYFGIVSGNKVKDKLAATNLKASKSKLVKAPIIEDFPLTMECRFVGKNEAGIVGEILNVKCDEACLDDNGNVDPTKLNVIMYDPFKHGYYSLGEKVGSAFKDGKKIK